MRVTNKILTYSKGDNDLLSPSWVTKGRCLLGGDQAGLSAIFCLILTKSRLVRIADNIWIFKRKHNGSANKKRKKSPGNNVQVIYTDEEVEAKGEKMKNKNTLRGEQRAGKAFKRYLEQAGVESLEYWTYPVQDLDKFLAKFYMGARKFATEDDPTVEQDPEQKSRKYSANSFKIFTML